jgi:hypothetical protein
MSLSNYLNLDAVNRLMFALINVRNAAIQLLEVDNRPGKPMIPGVSSLFNTGPQPSIVTGRLWHYHLPFSTDAHYSTAVSYQDNAICGTDSLTLRP